MEILQIVQTPSGRWQNTLQSDQADSDQPVALGPEFDTEMAAQEWLWLNGPEKARRMKVTINGTERWLRQSESPMTYERIVELAGQAGQPTVTYSRAVLETVTAGIPQKSYSFVSGWRDAPKPLIAGESLELAHYMHISVADTSNA